jgi:hypothetical protein
VQNVEVSKFESGNSRQELWESAGANECLRLRYELEGSDLCVRICVRSEGLEVAYSVLMPMVKDTT